MRNTGRWNPRSALTVRWLGLVVSIACMAPLESGAQQATPAPSPAASATSAAAAPLVYQSDTITTFRATVAGISPSRRAEIAMNRLDALRPAQMLQPVRTEPLEHGYFVLVGDTFAFFVMDDDVDARIGETTTQAAQLAASRLGQALAAQARLRAPGQRWRAVAMSIAATLVLVGLIQVLRWAGRHAPDWITSKTQSLHGKLKLGDVDIFVHFSTAVAWIVRIATQVGVLVLIVLWVVFVLSQFPLTRRWGNAAFSSLFVVLDTLRQGLFAATPGVIAVAVIVVIARFVSKLVANIFAGIERGTIRIAAIHPETASATQRLVNAMIWLFAIVVAYPFLPGSGSDAFKGVSVFLGLLVTLGSSGVVGHLMSGLVLVYSRALRLGDVVRVGDIEGMVTEVGALSVKIANTRKEEFTVPNTVIVGTTVKNFSRLARDTGPVLTTSVTIGYDAPWRVVYEMLLAAADRTPGIRKQPPPVVFQPSLSDFYVEYQLVMRLERSADRLVVLSQLHQNIQDAFNERGVQIMSPHYEGQPAQRVFVPKAQWTEAPGDTSGRP